MAGKADRIHLLFDFFDQDKDGLVSLEDLGTIARCVGKDLSEAAIQEVMAVAHHDGGLITEEELARLLEEEIRLWRSPPLSEIVESFRIFDKDRTGFISTNDFRTIMMYLGETLPDVEVDRMLSLCPPRADGMVDYEAFVRMVSEMPANAPLMAL